MELRDCAAWFRARDRFLLLTHSRPDGDTLCSAAALCRALRRAGKTAYLFENPQVTESYRGYVEPLYAPPGFEAAFAVSIDTADASMLPRGFQGTVDLALDHHSSNSGYAKECLVWPDKAACGELVLELLEALGDVDQTEAELLYIAVATDTGCFCFGNTRADTLRAAARLVELGADNARLNRLLFRSSSPARVALEGAIFATLRSERGGEIVIATVTQAMLEAAGTTEDDCEDLASLPGRVAGSRASVTIRELPGRHSKISLRTDGSLNAAAVCARFGGGGHSMAAGYETPRPPDAAAAELLEALADVMDGAKR